MKNQVDLINNLLEINNLEQNKKLQNNPTFFDILHRTYDEDLISRMLAYVLKNDKVLVWRLLFYHENKEPCPPNFEVESVECEKPMLNGRADIFVRAKCDNETYALTIENKVYSWEHDEQTKTYYKYVQNYQKADKKTYLFLKPKFNLSPIACTEFKPIDYNTLLAWISKTNDPKVSDFIKHIERYLAMIEIEFTEVDQVIVNNLLDFRNLHDSFEDKLTSFKRQLFTKLSCDNTIKGLNYNPYDQRKKRKEKDAKAKENNDLTIQIEDAETSFRIYKADIWDAGPYDENGYYFYVELKFDNNNPYEILFQKVAKQYGKYELSVVTQFIKNGDFGVELENPVLDGKYKPYFVFTSKKFESKSAPILSKEWQKELLEFAITTLSEDIGKMDIIVDKFNKWREKRS